MIFKQNMSYKGTDRLCKIAKHSMQCCRQILEDSFKTYKTFPRCIVEFERKVDVKIMNLGVHFQNQARYTG